ncbi:P27 family phage terminase small subunit [uncultured Treponema sp.]|uniref:P27 family phage terminase small subunit n=1 Tax=uncultured Treponema sp. TaxID=162155 RepID=UPI002586F00D|nr:P27 family phage terminase small subunit [uncultured Treponema sp.]
MGRPIKTTEEHIKDGTYRKDRHANRGVSLDALEEVSVPDGLNHDAKEKWLEIVPVLQKNGLVTAVDIPTLTDAFIAYGAAQDCLNAVLSEFNSIAEYWAQLNKFKDVDLIQKYNESMDIYKKTMEKYGVTPASRAKIKIQPKQEDEADNFIKTLRGNG